MIETSDDYDPDFGYMQHNNIDAWDCDVSTEFPYPPTYYFSIHIWSWDNEPTDLQREATRWLKANYARLWPELAETIVRLHPTLIEVSQLDGAIREWVSVHLGEHAEDSLELVYDLNLPDAGTRGFFITVSEQGIGAVFIAE